MVIGLCSMMKIEVIVDWFMQYDEDRGDWFIQYDED